MKVCPACGAENADDGRFCAACGARLVESCGVCGAARPAEARFCPSCGTPFAEDPQVAIGQERRVVTVLFADVTGSTGLGEQLDPERFQEVLATYFGAMREEIEAEGGTVEKFIGDAVMAAFGVPIAHEDDPARALRASLRMRRRLEQVNHLLEERHGVTLRIRTGVNTGEVLAATRPRSGEPMVTGDAVNVAARLEQTAEPGQIVVAERTARAARGFRYGTLAAPQLRGKDDVVAAVVLLEEAPEVGHRGIPGLRAPIVGRDRELELLETLYRVTADEVRPGLVTIYGEPGVGKSRLVNELTDRVERADPPARVLRGRCLPYGEGVTYWPLAEILKTYAGIFDTDAPAVVLAKIRTAASAVITTDVHEDPARAGAALAWTLGIDDPEHPLSGLDPRKARDQTHAAWRSFLSALATGGPIVAVVEDIHWADVVLLDLLEHLVDRVVGPVLFLCPARPELTELRPGWGGGRRNVSTIALDPLRENEARRLMQLLLSVEALPDAVRGRILEHAEGNPFFLEEIVRQLIDERRIVRERDRWRAAEGIEDIAIPDTIQGVLAARIDLLDFLDKRALQRAAVVGRVFWPGPVRRLLNGDATALEETLERLEERDLILSRLGSAVAGQPEFIFKHVLTRDVAYETLPRRERPAAHAEVAAWIEETAGDRREEFVDLLAHHYSLAHDAARDLGTDEEPRLRERAFSSLVLASRAAHHKVALGKARRLAQHAASVADGPVERSIALEALGNAANDDYRGDEAYRAFREAVDLRLADAPGDRMKIAYLCARTVEVPTRWPGVMMRLPPSDEVVPYLEIGLSHLDPGDSEERARLLIARSMLPFASFGRGYTHEQLEAHRADGEEAAEMAIRLGLPELASAAYDGVGACLLMQGRPGAQVDADRRRLALIPQLDDPAEIADLYSNSALGHIAIGRYREALELATKGVEAAIAEAPSYGTYSLVWTAVAHFRLGEWDSAMAAHERTLSMLGERRADPPRPWLQSFAIAALIADARGDQARADQEIEFVVRGAEAQFYRQVTGATWVALLLARRGRVDEARRLLDAMILPETQALATEIRCDVVAIAGAWEEAPAEIARAREVAEHAGSIALPLYASRLEGRTALAGGDADRAAAVLASAGNGFDELGARWERACTELSLAETLASAGRADEARPALDAATTVFKDLRSLPELARASEIGERLG